MRKKQDRKKQISTLKKVFHYMKRYIPLLVFSIVLATITVALTLYFPILTGQAIDLIVEKGLVDFDGILQIAIKGMVVVLITALAQWIMNMCNNRMTYNIVRDIRKDAFHKIEHLPLSYIDSHSHGDMVSRIIADVDTFADGIAVKTPGETTFKMIEQYVDGIVTVSEDEIAAAILALMENQKLVAEGAGATPVAAALFGKLPIEGKKTVCLISGGNIDVNILSRVITRGMIMSGRKTNLMIALEDKPGQLTRVSEIISGMGANVVSVQYDLADPNMTVTSCFLKLGLETRDHTQIEQIKAKLTEEGFKLVSERA